MTKLKELMIEEIAEFNLAIGNQIDPIHFQAISDSELFSLYRKIVWDEAYTDGHVEGYSHGFEDGRLELESRTPLE